MDAPHHREQPVSPVPVVAAALLLVLALRAIRLRRAAQKRARVAEQFPDVIDLLVVLVRAGLTPLQAVQVLGGRAPAAWRPAFAAVERARADGLRFADALDELVQNAGPVAQGIVDALRASDRYGQPLAVSLDRLATDGRAARRRLADQHARKLPVRLSFPLVCCTLPSFLLLTIAPLLAGALDTLTNQGITR